MNVYKTENLTRLGKTELAQILGGAFVSPMGQINSKKLRLFVCNVLDISEDEYKINHVFSSLQIEKFKEKGILQTG